jgi:hypothetical protein
MSSHALFLIILLVLLVILAYILAKYSCIRLPERTELYAVGSHEAQTKIGKLSGGAKHIVKVSAQIHGGSADRKGKESGPGAAAISSGDQNKVAEYIRSASRKHDDNTALELKSLKTDIVSVIRAYPGLVEYVRKIPIDETDNKNISDTIEEIQIAVGKIHGGRDSYRTVDEVYDLMKQYIREVGTSKHIEDYLKKRFRISSPVRVVDAIKKDKTIRHKALYQILEDVIMSNWSKEDFIEQSEVRYENFLPASKRAWLEKAYDYDVDIIPDLRNELRTYLHPEKAYTRADLDKILEKIERSLSIYKFAPGYAKKTKAAVNKAKGKAYAVDTLAVLPVIKAIASTINDEKKWSLASDIIKRLGIYELSWREEDAIRRLLRAIRVDDMGRETLLTSLERERERELRDSEFRKAHEAELRRKGEEIERLRQKAKEEQERADYEMAKRLQEQYDKESAPKQESESESESELESESESESESEQEEESEPKLRVRKKEESEEEKEESEELEEEKGKEGSFDELSLDNMNTEYDRYH